MTQRTRTNKRLSKRRMLREGKKKRQDQQGKDEPQRELLRRQKTLPICHTDPRGTGGGFGRGGGDRT